MEETQLCIANGSIVRHFKGDLYMVLNFATHTETKECLVVYKALYGQGTVWTRPLDMFMEKAPKDRHNPTGQKFRFQAYKPKRIG